MLSEENGWYKIKSGKVTGYVRADYMVTGEEARTCGQRGDEQAVCNPEAYACGKREVWMRRSLHW